jgi:hypothetical protein
MLVVGGQLSECGRLENGAPMHHVVSMEERNDRSFKNLERNSNLSSFFPLYLDSYLFSSFNY